MRKLKIGIDCDDVICEYVATLTQFYNKVYDDKLSIENVTLWDLKTAYEKTGTKESIRALMDAFIQNPLFMEMDEVPGAVASIHRLLEAGHEVYFISARGSKAIDSAYKWFYQHNLPLRNIYFNRDKHWLVDKLGIDVMIDDGIHNLNNINHELKGRCECVIYDRPWNRQVTTNGAFFRAANWKEVLGIVEHIAQ